MKFKAIALALPIALLVGCSGGGFGPTQEVVPPGAASSSAIVSAHRRAHQNVYWTLYAGCSYPQIQIARVPLNDESNAGNYYCSKRNGLGYTSGLSVDSSGRLWVLSFNGKHGGDPGLVAVFKLPLTATSVQQFTFVLSGSNGPDALAFDPSGNLWVTSPGNYSVLEYSGPFKKSGTLAPRRTIAGPPSFSPSGIAIDKSATLYVSDFNSTGTNSIAVLPPPYKKIPYPLNGLTAPGGLAFDSNGNLYASSNASAPAVARYDSDDLKSGDTPSIIDPTGIPASSYEAAFAFTAKGDLYAANCGNSSSAGIDVWPLSTQKFSSKLRPSVIYTTSDVSQIGCAWGIAIK